jgi:phosphatidylinositol alpha-1,6-mannosyltransferase
MERLSYELTTRMSRRRPVTIVAMRGRARALPIFLVAAAWRLLIGCARREVALVHLGDPVLAPLAAIARAFRIPVVVTLHGLDIVYAAPAYRLWRRVFLRGFDAYVCISDAARAAARAAGLPPGRLHVIGIGADAASRGEALPRERECVLFVGRLVRRKGLAWFVRQVLPALAAARPGLRLVVLGDGPEREAIVANARDAGVAQCLAWPASRDDIEKAAWFARATLCVLPNIRVPGDMEGFGIVALEAAAAGCPVVASDLEGLREALAGGKTGTLVTPEDAAAWIDAVSGLLDDPVQRERKADAARRHALRHFRWDDVVDAHERLFAAAIDRRGRRYA